MDVPMSSHPVMMRTYAARIRCTLEREEKRERKSFSVSDDCDAFLYYQQKGCHGKKVQMILRKARTATFRECYWLLAFIMDSCN